jgi:hypothetical protein
MYINKQYSNFQQSFIMGDCETHDTIFKNKNTPITTLHVKGNCKYYLHKQFQYDLNGTIAQRYLFNCMHFHKFSGSETHHQPKEMFNQNVFIIHVKNSLFIR